MENKDYNEQELPFAKLFESDEVKQRRGYRDMVDAATAERDIRNLYEGVKDKSVGTAKKTNANKKNKASKEVDLNRILEKPVLIISTIAIIFALGATAYVASYDQVNSRIEMMQNIKQNEELFREKALTNLLFNGLAEIQGNNKIVVKDNSIEDYYKLNIDNLYDIYGISLVLNDSQFNKFIQTVSYDNGNYNYVGTWQFLNVNGYVDSKTNEPSMKVFRNLIETKIAVDVPKSNLERWKKEDNILTFEDIIALINSETEGNVKGGK